MRIKIDLLQTYNEQNFFYTQLFYFLIINIANCNSLFPIPKMPKWLYIIRFYTTDKNPLTIKIWGSRITDSKDLHRKAKNCLNQLALYRERLLLFDSGVPFWGPRVAVVVFIFNDLWNIAMSFNMRRKWNRLFASIWLLCQVKWQLKHVETSRIVVGRTEKSCLIGEKLKTVINSEKRPPYPRPPRESDQTLQKLLGDETVQTGSEFVTKPQWWIVNN